MTATTTKILSVAVELLFFIIHSENVGFGHSSTTKEFFLMSQGYCNVLHALFKPTHFFYPHSHSQRGGGRQLLN